MSLFSNQISETKVGQLSIPGQKYSVKLAENREEVEKALRLRFDVFNIELGEGLTSSFENKMDEDIYDAQCHHLIVLENSTGLVIGTYRMQDNEMAHSGEGFYTQNEFDLAIFSPQVLENVVELGRACIHRDHRSGRVLFLLWRGLAKYLQLSGKRYLFGCCSLTSQNPAAGLQTYKYLQAHNYLHSQYKVAVQPEFECIEKASQFTFEDEVVIPQLFKLYLDLGCLVCSPPALDATFKTIDFLILLDKESLSEQSKSLFLR
jgi:putative hemolysin